MNGLNESDVTKVTCATNVTCETNVTNKFDETRFLSFMQSGASRHLRGRIAFQTDISTCYSAPSQNRTEKRKKKWRKRATSKRSNSIQKILPRVLRETNNPREPQSQRILLSSSSFRARSGSIFPNLMRLLLYFHQFTNLRFSTFLLSGR